MQEQFLPYGCPLVTMLRSVKRDYSVAACEHYDWQDEQLHCCVDYTACDFPFFFFCHRWYLPVDCAFRQLFLKKVEELIDEPKKVVGRD